jgi:methionyl-tRNA synthetase
MKPNTTNLTLITTAISYVNGEPHIGHMYEMILADFVTKWHKICQNHDVRLLTGTDEHGKKIQQIANSMNIEPIDLCNLNAEKFKKLANDVKMSYDHFIRTTDKSHIEFVQNAISDTILKSDIYLGSYEGYYSIREESYISESDAKMTNYKDPLTDKPYEYISEPSYYFKLGSYSDFVKSNLSDSLPIKPYELNHQLITRLEENELRDLSISRTTFDWGIKFPNDPDHVVYVWFDALLNYLSGANIIYNDTPKTTTPKTTTPKTTTHIIGKDIIWFHAIIYPAILKSINAEYAIASNILVHGFILDDKGIKMSKSLNNVIYPSELLSEYPLDAIRYYLISDTDFATNSDIRFNKSELVAKYNNVLIKDFGNLIQRIFCLIKPIQTEFNNYLLVNNLNLISNSEDFMADLNQMLKTYDIVLYNNYLNELLAKSNKELSDKKPWLIKDQSELDRKLSILYQILSQSLKATIMFNPILTSKSEEILSYFGLNFENIYELNQISISVDKIKVFDQI